MPFIGGVLYREGGYVPSIGGVLYREGGYVPFIGGVLYRPFIGWCPL